jgi:acetyl esterase/lipase
LDKNKYNKILLFIHGGAWIMGDKSSFNFLCIELAKKGYITASMAHTFLNDTNHNSSIFRILDEVASVIKNIKKNLKDKGFDETKLELAIGGGSSGAHISLLYAYSYKKSPMEIKYVINLVGPVTLESKYYYVTKNPNEPLVQIDEENIKKNEEEKKIEPIKNSSLLAILMNLFLGYKENDNLEQMVKASDENEIDTESQKYKELLEKVQIAFPVAYVNKNTPPTICLYTGKDDVIGVKHYSYLKSKFDKAENKKIDLIYLKGLPHGIFVPGSQEATNGMIKLFELISNYSSKYFTQNNK